MKKSKKRGNPLLRWRFVYTVTKARIYRQKCKLQYVLKVDDPEIASNAVVVVDATTQWSRPSSRPGSAAASPRPIIGLCISGVIEALITAAAPV